jgi:hypothetical protein
MRSGVRLVRVAQGETPIWNRLIAFWRDNTAQSHPELMINNMAIEWMRMVNRGMLPMFQDQPELTTGTGHQPVPDRRAAA